MSSWVASVKQFYVEKIVHNGFNLNGSEYSKILQNVPREVLDAYNYLGREDSDPQPGFYTFEIQEQNT